jgi:hypothetical protein
MDTEIVVTTAQSRFQSVEKVTCCDNSAQRIARKEWYEARSKGLSDSIEERSNIELRLHETDRMHVSKQCPTTDETQWQEAA